MHGIAQAWAVLPSLQSLHWSQLDGQFCHVSVTGTNLNSCNLVQSLSLCSTGQRNSFAAIAGRWAPSVVAAVESMRFCTHTHGASSPCFPAWHNR